MCVSPYVGEWASMDAGVGECPTTRWNAAKTKGHNSDTKAGGRGIQGLCFRFEKPENLARKHATQAARGYEIRLWFSYAGVSHYI